METLQNLLTIAAEATVIVGLAGIFAHALYTQHQSFMATYCPAVKLYQPEVQAQEAPTVVEVEQPTAADPWTESEVETVTNVISFQPVSRHFSPQLALPAAKEEIKPANKAATRKPRSKTHAPRRRKTA
jgi:hypothetical protein